MQTKQVLLFTRKAALDTDHLHRFVYVRVFHVADGAGNVEDELQYFRGTRQCFWRSMDFAGEHAMQEIIDEVFFAHLVNLREHRLALRVSGLDRKSTRLNSSHSQISYAVFCLKKKKNKSII